MGVINFFISLGAKYGVFGIFVGSMLESFGVPFAGSSLILGSGYLISIGTVTFPGVVLAGTLGNVLGSAGSYGIGYVLGNKIRNIRGGYIFRSDKKIDKFIEKYGSISAFFAQLYGTARTFISYPAGMMKMNFKKFIVYTALGGFVFSAFVATFSYYIRGFYYKLLYPYLGLSFGTAAILFMVAFVFTHFVISNSRKINDFTRKLLGIDNEDNKN